MILYTLPDCHLCHRLEDLVRSKLPGVQIERRDIRDHRDWLRAYRHRIPVLVVDDRVILEGNPSEAEVDAALARL